MSIGAAGPSTSPPGSPTSPTAPASPINAGPAALSPQSGALTTTPTTGTVGAANTGGAMTTNASGDLTNPNGYNSMGYGGMGYGGMGYGMDPYGMGMGYGGMGMGYGGLGMMGMGGMGMMGMGMYGMTPEAQRAQMMMMMTNSIMQLWGMFSQVMQMTLGSAVQFVGEYVGINQRLGQIEEEHLNLEERYQNRKYDLRKALADIPKEQRYVPKAPRMKKPKQPSMVRRFIVRLLRHVAFFVVAYFVARKLASWVTARSGKKLLETSASKVFSAPSKLN
ncbi:hypothetical protein ABB37_00736 [Leptomonas pyrrhocoris]|uniref:Peroxin-13 n=1 Tax=Leptomonas pyrrhocoris TaxID=157538 RepID=A0A0M9GB24_LEPPY|nr:hypothetical protein ABB37_00736 [Leptomonas pyrrhocoris]XP_015665067.1 hypothetical protein ABB37_00736 [Leptomonas pyrrhocoris]XP_015665068.1 hypothetical protein ABB37_00736 [Leptomonas pyrrhocoris]KPA86627.1 hypothetical protein ABB37_00736 [Leptomonas pyrrhocoris]KPA86628.1 hypothetical protein ABB37_00736 [Leptomonas pyrrhocoris]KPA86629.1 hypothetical protein ABB37_00736 [Leptomonas pyrrhocoris]|eukprot:XP_015665066.1 hypothetical protein ABB37_00736 [Leptomonas pyrrhocoris]